MAYIALFFAAMIGLWAFIRYDQRRLTSQRDPPLSRDRMAEGVDPNRTSAWLPSAGVAGLCGVSAVVGLLSPLDPPFTGRFAVFKEALFNAIGPYGWALAFGAISVIATAVAVRAYRASQAVTRRSNA